MLDLTAMCGPDCGGQMTLAVGLNPPNVSAMIDGPPIPCDSLPHVRTVTIGIDADAPPFLQLFGIDGIAPAGATCGIASFVRVAGVSILEWAEFDPVQSTPLESPDPNNGGVRMFPGKATAVDAFEADRRKVDLVATVNPIAEGCTVYFRTWDVDDPFDQNNAGMANVNLIDADTSGPDNRPAGAADSGVGQWQAVTDAAGAARVTIEVSMQPGNNYRAAASLMLNGVADATVTQAAVDADTPPTGVTFSDMLTIWRKLHVETDTIVRPSFSQNTWMMDWTSPQQGGAAAQIVFDVDDPFFESPSLGGFWTLEAREASFHLFAQVPSSRRKTVRSFGLLIVWFLSVGLNPLHTAGHRLHTSPPAELRLTPPARRPRTHQPTPMSRSISHAAPPTKSSRRGAIPQDVLRRTLTDSSLTLRMTEIAVPNANYCVIESMAS